MAADGEKTPTQTGAKRRRATRREMAKRDLRFLEKLAAGVTIEEIAASEKISLSRARERKRAILANRAIDPPQEFIQLQIRRLNEAMLVAYSAVSAGDLKAVDQVIKVVRELDRYHGFGPYPGVRSFAAPRSAEPPPLALPEPPAALAAPEAEMADGTSTSRDDPTSGEEGAVKE
jgi:hypothetical protein